MLGKLVVVGSINVDHILHVTAFPQPGQTIRGEQYQLSFGGKGANQAVAAARSGAATRFVACVGEDVLGGEIRQFLTQQHIDVMGVSAIQGASTGIALILVNQQGENVITIHAGANSGLTAHYVMRYQSAIQQAGLLLLQLESPLEGVLAAVQVAKHYQVPVLLNPAPAQPLSAELWRHIDIITPNKTEAESLSGVTIHHAHDLAQAAHKLHANGVATVVITLGGEGVWLSQQGQGQLLPSFAVQGVDTVGAGDTFNGALAAALLEGVTLVAAVQFAQAAAALSVTRQGVQTAIPHRTETLQFLHHRGIAWPP